MIERRCNSIGNSIGNSIQKHCFFGFACFVYIPVFLNHFGKRDSAKSMTRYIRSTYKEDQKSLSQYLQFGKHIREFLDMSISFLSFLGLEVTNFKIAAVLRKKIDYGSLDLA